MKVYFFILIDILMVVYSFSQINLYEQCPKKYQYRYLDGLEREFETSPDLIL
ncbi:PD-(D/E)XK nuclease family protein [bacterium]|nr:PD-(D/E)XK nuclease family protein [bacterium]MBR4567558.1 PD-(D/E)XK nuclease family protein [bacterium]